MFQQNVNCKKNLPDPCYFVKKGDQNYDISVLIYAFGKENLKY